MIERCWLCGHKKNEDGCTNPKCANYEIWKKVKDSSVQDDTIKATNNKNIK